MEFAVSALLLLVLLLPGFILQLSYTKGVWRWNSPVVNRPITEQIPSSIIIAGVLHLIWTPIASLFGEIKYDVLLMFLTGNFGHDEEKFSYALDTIAAHPYKPAIYIFSLYAFAALMGYLAHIIVRGRHWDHKFRFVRFNNEWFYWLRAEITQFSETDDLEGEIIGTVLSAVVHHKEDYLYTGIVIDYFFDKEGNLDRVILDQASRRKLCDDREQAEATAVSRYYSIEGHYVILRYSEMVTVSLRYLTVIQTIPTAGPSLNPKPFVWRARQYLAKILTPQD